jgi:arylsulfatase
MRWPGVAAPGRVTPDMASTLDLHATALAAAGAAAPKQPLDGYDLRPWLSGEVAESPRKELFYFHQGKLKAVRMGPWKLKMDTGEPELYHLELDPSEQYNRAEGEAEVVARLRKRMAEMAAEVGM